MTDTAVSKSFSPRRIAYNSLLTLGLVLLPGQGCAEHDERSPAEELLDRIGEQSYQDWQRPENFPGREPSRAPHGESVEIFLNPVLTSALDEDKALQEWPEGSLIAKRGYDKDQLRYIAVMEKTEGKWFWVEEVDGTIKYSGDPVACTSCHLEGADFVLSVRLP